MTTLTHTASRVHPSLRIVDPTPPCPSEARYGAACYLTFFRDRKRHCPRCLAECPTGDVPAWMARPQPSAPGEALLPMADWIEVKAAEIRLLGTELAGWLADRVDDLAAECRLLEAATTEEFDGRSAIMTDLIARHDRREDEMYSASLPG
jgi:hypothetical protein